MHEIFDVEQPTTILILAYNGCLEILVHIYIK